MTKQKINQIVGSIGALSGLLYLSPTSHKFLPIYKATKVNRSSLYPQQYLV